MTQHPPTRTVTSEDASALDEPGLAEGLERGAPEAVEQFLIRTHHAVFGLAGRLTRDPERRRDWTHAVLLALLEDFRKGRFVYRRPGSLWAWFRKRAYFRLLDEYRRHRLRETREMSAGEDEPPAAALGRCGVNDPAAEIERVEIRSAFEACLAGLENADHRRAVELLLIEECDYQEIADGLRAPLNTVRAWIRRGRIALRRCLAARLGLAAGKGVNG